MPFGLLRTDDSQKPSAITFRQAAKLAVNVDWPTPSQTTPAPQPEPSADPWYFFSSEQIASLTACPVAAVTENWPKVVAQLVLAGINDRPTQIAMLGTIAIETAHTFKPVREAFWNTEEWRRINLSRYYPYYGRGYIQLTWRDNYATYGPKIATLWGAGGWEDDFNLVQFPDNALNPDIAAAVSALYFRDHGGTNLKLIPNAAARQDWAEVRRLVQGGSAGLADFRQVCEDLWNLPLPGTPEIPPVESYEQYKTAIKYLVDVVLPKVAGASEERERGIAEAIRVRQQFIGDN